MNNPNCPDPHYPEFNPETQECFNTETHAQTYKAHTQQQYPIATRSLILIAIGATITFAIARNTR